MDWDDLRTFLAVARERTLSGAARSLGVTQSTMSRRMAAMEARSGARLLQRTPGGYVLTPLGEAVLGNVERMEAEALATHRLVAGRDVALEGTVRVTTVDTLAARVLVPAIAAVHRAHPGIAVELVPDTRSLSLSRREADVAVRMARFEGAELVQRRLGGLAFGLYAAPAYLDRHGGLDGDPARHAIVTVLDDQAHLPEARFLSERLPGARAALRSNSRSVQQWGTLSGIGIACLSCFRADAEPGLVRLSAPGEGPVRDIWLGVHRDLRHAPRVRAVIDAIAAEVQAQGPRLMP